MTRYTLRALAAQWRAWSGTVAVLALAAGLINVCLVHRMTVTRPDVVAAARAAGVDPADFEADPRRYDIPDSVIGFLQGELGEPPGGWPEPFRTKVLAGRTVRIGVTDVAVIGLAKRLEEVWLPGEEYPVILPRASEGLYLLQPLILKASC